MTQALDPTDMAFALGRRLFMQNPNRDDWNNQITHIAGVLDTTEDAIRDKLAGFWDKDRAARLKLEDPAIWIQLETWYNNQFCRNAKPNRGRYDFIHKASVGSNCPQIQHMINHHLNTVARYALMGWRANPHDEKFHIFAGHFNFSANILNSKAKVQIPLAKTPPKRKHKPSFLYTQGLFFCTFSGMTDAVLGCPEVPWLDTLRNLQDENNLIDLEAVKSSNPGLYNQLTTYHMTQKVVLHRKSKTSTCTIPKNLLGQLAEMFIAQLKSGLNLVTPETDLKNFTHFRKTKTDLWLWKHKVNDPYLRCPCFSPQTSTQCTSCFNVKDRDVVADLHNIFDKVPGVQDKARALYEEIRRVTTLLSQTYRTHPICPQCHTQNINEEAIRNQTGDNPAVRHPTDVECQSCKHEFCTDCLTSHPGIICRGWSNQDNHDNVVQACPGCKHPTDRIDGCAFIQCEIPTFNKMWCWVCRCFRKREMVNRPQDPNRGHICLVIGKAENNPVWRGNPNVKLYESNAPGHKDWVPL